MKNLMIAALLIFSIQPSQAQRRNDGRVEQPADLATRQYLDGKVVSKFRHREINATCAATDASGTCQAFHFYYRDRDANVLRLITKTAFTHDGLAALGREKRVFLNVFTETPQSATQSVIEFVRDAGGSWGDSKFAAIGDKVTRGAGYVIAAPIGAAGDVVGYALGSPYIWVARLFKNPKYNKLVQAFSTNQAVRINVAKIETLKHTIYCAGEEAQRALNNPCRD